jgi:hypothetical protein
MAGSSLGITATVVAILAVLQPPTPPLLRNAFARGGWWSGGCPPTNEIEQKGLTRLGEALSPELDQRLRTRFPPGSAAGGLERYLRSQGFDQLQRCVNDPSISQMDFIQTGGGFYGPYPMFAEVAWKQDGAGRIVWTKGYVAFTGP